MGKSENILISDVIAESRKNREAAKLIVAKLGIDRMKLDLELVRDILAYVEENQVTAYATISKVPLDGRDSQEIAYHVARLKAEGFIDATAQVTGGTEPGETFLLYSIHAIEWDGHALLDMLREDTWMKKAKAVASKVGATSLTKIFTALQDDVVKMMIDAMKGG